MNKTDITKYILLWAELVDMGEACALKMIRRRQPTANAMIIFKKAIEEQSLSHHQANVEILRRLCK